MSVRVVWEPAAEAAISRIPQWRTAARVSEAVYVFAASTHDDVERLPGDRFRLRAAGYVVVGRVDRHARTLHVVGVFLR